MIDYDETENDKKRRKEKLLIRGIARKKFHAKRNKMSMIFFGIPAFLPILFSCLGLEINTAFKHVLENIEILKNVNATLDDSVYKCIIFSGYTFSFIYLLVISPYIYTFQKRAFLEDFTLNKHTKTHLFYLIVFCLFLFLISVFVDFSSGGSSTKYRGVIELSFYIWPLFYGYFILPVYLSVVLAFGLLTR